MLLFDSQTNGIKIFEIRYLRSSIQSHEQEQGQAQSKLVEIKHLNFHPHIIMMSMINYKSCLKLVGIYGQNNSFYANMLVSGSKWNDSFSRIHCYPERGLCPDLWSPDSWEHLLPLALTGVLSIGSSILPTSILIIQMLFSSQLLAFEKNCAQ